MSFGLSSLRRTSSNSTLSSASSVSAASGDSKASGELSLKKDLDKTIKALKNKNRLKRSPAENKRIVKDFLNRHTGKYSDYKQAVQGLSDYCTHLSQDKGGVHIDKSFAISTALAEHVLDRAAASKNGITAMHVDRSVSFDPEISIIFKLDSHLSAPTLGDNVTGVYKKQALKDIANKLIGLDNPKKTASLKALKADFMKHYGGALLEAEPDLHARLESQAKPPAASLRRASTVDLPEFYGVQVVPLGDTVQAPSLSELPDLPPLPAKPVRLSDTIKPPSLSTLPDLPDLSSAKLSGRRGSLRRSSTTGE